MLQTLVFIASCVAPLGVFIWSALTEMALADQERQKRRAAFDDAFRK